MVLRKPKVVDRMATAVVGTRRTAVAAKDRMGTAVVGTRRTAVVGTGRTAVAAKSSVSCQLIVEQCQKEKCEVVDDTHYQYETRELCRNYYLIVYNVA